MRRAILTLAHGAEALARQAAGPAPLVAVQPVAQHLAAATVRSAAGSLSRSQARWSHCSCSGDLSLPPPQKVLVEYDPAEVDTFIAFADAVEEEFEGIMVDGVEVSGRPQAFDVKLEDGSMVFSRNAGALPDYTDLFARLRQAGVQAATA